jgi:hypothetical protein
MLKVGNIHESVSVQALTELIPKILPLEIGEIKAVVENCSTHEIANLLLALPSMELYICGSPLEQITVANKAVWLTCEAD